MLRRDLLKGALGLLGLGSILPKKESFTSYTIPSCNLPSKDIIEGDIVYLKPISNIVCMETEIKVNIGDELYYNNNTGKVTTKKTDYHIGRAISNTYKAGFCNVFLYL